jgi:hypothetical protein
MNAGRELDALVAEKVMGWIWMRDPACGEGVYLRSPATVGMLRPEYLAANRVDGYEGEIPRSVPHYSTDIAAAWVIVEHLRKQGKALVVAVTQSEVCVDNYNIDGIPLAGWTWESPTCHASAETAPHAICLAALKALDV